MKEWHAWRQTRVMVKFRCRTCCGRGSPLHESSPSSWLGARSIILCPLHFRSSYLTRRFTVASSLFHHLCVVSVCVIWSCAPPPLCCAASPEALRPELHESPMPSALQRPQSASSTHREHHLPHDLHSYYHVRDYLLLSALSQAQLLPRQQMHRTHD